ncbi:M23 family metallopeptidase [Tunturiibacter empetritectus]|uniref:M23ase beta-sheet core domain-containing protein n=1 Tax=Tunturiibacter lichenicola TaxID=2051959 RepID=A0A852V9T0_9BACT|nr:M23 family metallopeptidase [Edaphobacter lichenicola]NYF89653.1 hypothetical protein [Edaphobacter lichenicola]
MRDRRHLLTLWALVLFTVPAVASPAANPTAKSDQFTPLIASAHTPNARPFLGTDNRIHIVYELLLTNTNATPATLQTIDVVDASSPSTVLAGYSGKQLLTHLRSTNGAPVTDTTIEFNGSRLFLLDIALDQSASLPAHLAHHLELLGGATPAREPATPTHLSYTAAPITLLHKLPTIGPPLRGKGWVVLNGCCGLTGAHRSTGLAINGDIFYAQRFAIDWMLLDKEGRLIHGDAANVRNYTAYDADVIAVADATVVSTRNDLTDQVPGVMPDPKTINLENVDGNHVVLNLGDGVFAFYAHLQKGSVLVSPGDHVKRGQLLGKLGNTGNTSGPHLHFHLMEGASELGSNGIAYAIDHFDFAGQISAQQFQDAKDLEGVWNKGLLPTPSPRHDQFPLDLDIIDFPTR